MRREILNKKSFICLWLLILGFSCVEEIPIETEIQTNTSIEQLLVVEATLTNELQIQRVLLSRGSSFANESEVLFERNANVTVRSDNGETFLYVEQAPGQYVSQAPFAARSGNSYQLQIETSDGVVYTSEQERITGQGNIARVYAQRRLNENGEDGVAIFVDSQVSDGTPLDFRYVYEETYKIIAPKWTAFEFKVLSENDVRLVPRQQEEQVCYGQDFSTSILVSDGVETQSGELIGNQLKFLSASSPRIAHRYSILVKQYTQSSDASRFYRTLKQYSENENLFSTIQPGLLEGNLSSSNGLPVIGFFDVAGISEQRLFFDYEDFFPEEPLPPYFDELNCDLFFGPWLNNPNRDGPVPPNVTCGQTLVELVNNERVEFFEGNTNPPGECQGPYLVVVRACGDCTVFGSNVVPDFWVEE